MRAAPIAAPSAALPAALAALPPGTTTRWITHRDGAVVAAVRAGVVTLHALSVEEFASWQRRGQRRGDRRGPSGCARPAAESARARLRA
jgi:hypothetical protein